MKALVVDDEPLARERLIRLLSAFQDIQIVGEAGDGPAALAMIEQLKPDLVFLDIEMPGLNGLETAAAIGLDGPSIVFVTAYDTYALQAFDAHAFDYLVKPVAPERLATALQKIRQKRGLLSAQTLTELLSEFKTRDRMHRLAFKSGRKHFVLSLDQISAIIARDHYAEVLHGQERTLADDALETLEQRLDPQRFVRIHRSSIINLDYLKEINREGDRKYLAVLSDYFETSLPIGRQKLEILKKHLSL